MSPSRAGGPRTVPSGGAVNRSGAAMPNAFLVAGVGASAGGLDAFRRLLAGVSDASRLALLVVQHLDPDHKSLLADLLASSKSMNIREAQDGQIIAPGHAYVIPPGRFMTVEGGVIRLSLPDTGLSVRHPIDRLFVSLAAAFGSAAIGIVLSGTGADGSAGVLSINAVGGRSFAQDPLEAVARQMPDAAIATGHVRHAMPAQSIGIWLSKQSSVELPGTMRPETLRSAQRRTSRLSSALCGR